MENAPADRVAELDERWRERRIKWGRKLGRLRLGVEPLADQLARHRLVVCVLSAVSAFMGFFFIALFSAFSRPDIGLIFVAVFLLPIILTCWIGYLRLVGRAHAFEREFAAYQSERSRMIGSDTETNTTPEST